MENNTKTPTTMQRVATRESSPIQANLVSQTPGRLRLRVIDPDREHQEIERITKALKESLEMYRVRANNETGSITIFYSKDYSSFEHTCAKLNDLGVIFSSNTNEKLNITHLSNGHGKSRVAAGITNAVTGLNQQVKRATDSTVDLRFLLPLGFSVLAVRQLLLKGLMIESIPWYVLAWYAFDSFIKLHYTSEPQSRE